MKYKIYKNKLTNILRYCEREYYNKSLELHKKDIKKTWKILNEVINKRCKSNSFSKNFIEDGKEITNKQEIADGFNNYFVNIGPELARNIVPPEHMDIYHFFLKQYFIRSGSRLVAYTSPCLYIYKLQMKNSIQNTIHRIT